MAHRCLSPRGAMACAWTMTTTTRITRDASLLNACLARPAGEVLMRPRGVALDAENHGLGRNPALQHALASQGWRNCRGWYCSTGPPVTSPLLGCSARIERAAHPAPAALQHMRVDHSRTDVLMPQEFLHRPNVVAIL